MAEGEGAVLHVEQSAATMAKTRSHCNRRGHVGPLGVALLTKGAAVSQNGSPDPPSRAGTANHPDEIPLQPPQTDERDQRDDYRKPVNAVSGHHDVRTDSGRKIQIPCGVFLFTLVPR